jgi:beta-glucanase (GH16 family)
MQFRLLADAFFTDAEYPNMGCSEIDIVEYSPFFGNSYTATMHFWDRNTGEHLARGNWIETPQLIYPDYHEYACIWNEDGIYFYFDGKPYLANEAIFTPDDAVEAYTFLSNNSARIHEGLEWLGPCTDDMFPFVATFDWVRIYR